MKSLEKSKGNLAIQAVLISKGIASLGSLMVGIMGGRFVERPWPDKGGSSFWSWYIRTPCLCAYVSLGKQEENRCAILGSWSDS